MVKSGDVSAEESVICHLSSWSGPTLRVCEGTNPQLSLGSLFSVVWGKRIWLRVRVARWLSRPPKLR
jgi:hypothetical protein